MGLIPDEIIDQVIDRSDIVEVISSYVPLKRAGKNFKANCPFHHEKTPSFMVNPQKQIYHCFGCGEGGNVISFVMKQDRLEFPEAIRQLAAKVNVEIPTSDAPPSKSQNLRQAIFKVNALAVDYFHRRLLSDKSQAAVNARKYLKQRDVDLATAQTFKLGLAPDQWDGLMNHLKSQGITLSLMEQAGLIIAREKKDGYYDRFRNRIVFPILDTRANCRAFGARALEETEMAKYINSPETPVYTKGHHLYGFHLARTAITELDYVIVVEGYMDCLMPYQAGVQNIVASLGTALTVEQIRLIRRYTKNVVMLFDTDPAGEAAMARSFDTLVEEGMNVRIAELEEGEDPDSFIRQHGSAVFRERIDEAKGLFDYQLERLKKQFDPNTVEGKAKISAIMLPTIKRYDNAVLRSGYVKRLSELLLVSKEALNAELDKITIQPQRWAPKEEAPKAAVNADQHRSVELNILKLLLEQSDYISPTKEEVEVTDFQDGRVRTVITKIFEMFDAGKEVSVGRLMSSVEEKETQELISLVAAKDEFLSGDIDKIHRDCLNRMKRDRLQMQKQELMQMIRDAEAAGDEGRLDELKKAFNHLVRQ